MEKDFKKILKKWWGYSDFRPLQEEIISSVVAGCDTMAILPTGGGKSLTYQVPSQALDGLTIVVSPLIALMVDQVDNLKKRGIRAEVLHSGLKRNKILEILEQAQYGAFKLLYVSPERLASELFQKRLPFIKLSLFAIDEAHCISEWGYDFRPNYLKICALRELYPEVPMLALTASATPDVLLDIQDKLQLRNTKLFRAGVERDNLVYVVRKVRDKIDELLKIVNSVDATTIIYARSRAHVEELSKVLISSGISANFYHAGLNSFERNERQNSWMIGETRVLCATNAFGMGIDKSDVRMVIHYDIPDALEQYYQEAGRAGRDGVRSYAVLLATEGDIDRLTKRHETAFPPKERVRDVYQQLANYYVIGEGSGCGAVYPFILEEFCAICKLSYSLVLSSLNILEWSGYLTLTEAMDNASKLQILMPPNELFEWRMQHPKDDRIIELMMRLYTGIFTEPRHIKEEYIAGLLNITSSDVYRTLLKLAQQGVVRYIPFKHTPLLIYNTDREDAATLFIPPQAYEHRVERIKHRLASIYNYVTDTTTCRTQLLALYFGQTDPKPCNHCDNCLANRKKDC